MTLLLFFTIMANNFFTFCRYRQVETEIDKIIKLLPTEMVMKSNCESKKEFQTVIKLLPTDIALESTGNSSKVFGLKARITQLVATIKVLENLVTQFLNRGK